VVPVVNGPSVLSLSSQRAGTDDDKKVIGYSTHRAGKLISKNYVSKVFFKFAVKFIKYHTVIYTSIVIFEL